MDRGQQWRKAKETYVALVLKEAPVKLGKEQLIGGIVNKHDGELVKGCHMLDELQEQFESCNHSVPVETVEKILLSFAKNSADLRQDISTMTTSLRVAAEHYKDDRAPGTPKMKEALVRGLKVMKTALDAIDQTNAAWIITARDQLKVRAQQRLNPFQTMSNSYLPTLKATVARGLAAAQRMKANPNPKAYNAEFPKAARDIYMQINNVPVLIQKGYPPPGPHNVGPLAAGLKPFAEAPLNTVDLNSPPATVLQLVSQFNQAVKAVAAAYTIG
jgi:hypothetical protein